MPYTGVFPAVEPPSAAGICSVYVTIFQACPCFASGTHSKSPVALLPPPRHRLASTMTLLYVRLYLTPLHVVVDFYDYMRRNRA